MIPTDFGAVCRYLRVQTAPGTEIWSGNGTDYDGLVVSTGVEAESMHSQEASLHRPRVANLRPVQRLASTIPAFQHSSMLPKDPVSCPELDTHGSWHTL
eukprot:6354386-Prymnesium_polylepis.1